MQSTSLAGRSILIVEDEPLSALDIVIAFQSAGALVLMARSLDGALELAEHDGLSAAVLDFGLGDGDAGAVCGTLKERDIPFILHSGYTHTADACHGGTVVPKPAPPATLISTIVSMLHERTNHAKHSHCDPHERIQARKLEGARTNLR